METTEKCQICKRRKAKKRLSRQLDEGYFLVCGKIKCINVLYDTLYSTNINRTPSQEEEARKNFIEKNSHDPMDWQGRSYDRVKFMEIAASLTLAVGFFVILLAIIYKIFS
jgi:hypothetical protein